MGSHTQAEHSCEESCAAIRNSGSLVWICWSGAEENAYLSAEEAEAKD
jgi:hypothetical protein